MDLTKIRESERKSHIEMYSNEELYKEGSWLRKPIKAVLDLFPLFEDYEELNVLDLGSGVGRNSLAIARHFTQIPCRVECVDILDLAIEKLGENAREYEVEESVYGIVSPIEDFPIEENKYDFILAVSALEHIDSKESFKQKLGEIKQGIREGGVACLIINSEVRENDKETGENLPPQFEVNLPTEEMQTLLNQTFDGLEVLKASVREQQYDIPREDRISHLQTNVVTLIARNKFEDK